MNDFDRLYQIIFISSATYLLDEDELGGIEAHAGEQAKQLGITGALVYKAGNFFGIYEGGEASVKRRIEDAFSNPLHKSHIILHEELVEDRVFADWKMHVLGANADKFLSYEELKLSANRSVQMLYDFVRNMR